MGLKLENTTLDLLGHARKVVVDKDSTTIIEGAGDEDSVKGRIAQIKREIEDTDSDWDREKLQERLAKLAGGVAVVKVGAAAGIELKEKKHRIEDALSATRAAIEEGVVAGGGTALLRCRSALEKTIKGLSGDDATGARIVYKALEEPLKWIAMNAGLEGAVMVQGVERESGSVGLNATTGQFEDLLKAGVIDPAKVVLRRYRDCICAPARRDRIAASSSAGRGTCSPDISFGNSSRPSRLRALPWDSMRGKSVEALAIPSPWPPAHTPRIIFQDIMAKAAFSKRLRRVAPALLAPPKKPRPGLCRAAKRCKTLGKIPLSRPRPAPAAPDAPPEGRGLRDP